MHTEGPRPRVFLSQTLWAIKLPIQFNQTYSGHSLKDATVGLPWGLSGKESYQCRGTCVQSLVRKDLTCCRATKPVCHYYEAHVLEPESCNYGAHEPQLPKLVYVNLGSATGEATTMRSPCTTTNSSPAYCN